MTIRRMFTVREHRTPVDGALLLLRLVAGLAFMFHGWGKIQNPFGWMGSDGFAPGFLQGLAALSEFGGGLAWMIGLAMPLASLGIAATMAVAATYHVAFRGDPFVAMGGGPSFELAAVYLCLALLLLAAGPGRFSLDRLLFGRRG